MTRGYIVPIGGAEDKVRDAAILRRFASICGGSEARIIVIPTASQLLETADQYLDIFGSFGVADVFSLDFEARADCKRPDWLERLRSATGVFITGGNQLRLSTTIGGTEVADFIREANRNEGLHVAGTSAGASVMAEHMIAYGDEGATPRSDMVTLVPGLGLTHSIIVDQHFRQRDRLGRLLTSLAYNPRPIGIGLDEDTAAFISPERVMEVVGSGAITIVDAAEMEYSTMDSTRRHEPVCLTNIRL
ncbi:MAG: cyanophycinase, partial [Candidatus Brocadiia bacterium]|nr:cyanophycinase [Candidatus Brocadiia bacterium]